MLAETYPLYLANKPLKTKDTLPVIDKYSGAVASHVSMADVKLIDKAIACSQQAKQVMAMLPAYERQSILNHCVDRFKARFDEFAHVLCIEAGKPIKDAEGEVSRLIDTFRIAGEESVRVQGEVMPMDISPRAKGYRGMWKRVPIGPCSFISPFNFPLNLAAHKIAPAIAAGCPFVLKPASLTPIGALLIGEVLSETSLPEGAFSILPCHRDGASLFTEDERLKLLSFTGSPTVGWALKQKAGKKPVVLELGGNAACIIDEDTPLDDAVDRVIFGAFYQSGQSCIGVQRILIHEKIYEPFKEKLIRATQALKIGDPKSRDTFIGPMISEAEASRLDQWIQSAIQSGATCLCGGERDGSMLQATLLEGVNADEAVVCEEAFGPVAVLESFDSFDDALNRVNASKFGLQAGIFTRDIHKINKAWDTLEVGGVVINDVPSWRVDHMPYGGVKESGLGREGIRFAIEDMTEIKLLVVRDAPSS